MKKLKIFTLFALILIITVSFVWAATNDSTDKEGFRAKVGPQITLSSAWGKAADAWISWVGNVETFYCGVDDSADSWICGLGTAVGTYPAITIADSGTNVPSITFNGHLNKFAQNAAGTDNTLTVTDCKSTQYMGIAGLDLTLPALTAGCKIKFVMKTLFATTNMTVLSAGGANIIEGLLNVNATDVECANEDRVSFVNNAENVGDFFILESDGTSWHIGANHAMDAGGITCDTVS